MKRLLTPIFIGILLTLLFVVLAAFGGGACHCERPMVMFFPYVSMLGVHAEWGYPALLLLVSQFPLYAIIFARMNGPNWKARVLVILLAIHALATFVAFQISG